MMNFKVKLFLSTLILIIVSASLTFFLSHKDLGNADNYKPGVRQDIDQSVNQAKVVYDQYKSLGTDFSSGPCLSNALLPGWVLDVAHNPRTPGDDLPQNQCSALKEGKAKHFVELDPDGKLIKVK